MAQINAALMFGYKFLQHSAAESETFITMRGLVHFSVCRLLTASSGLRKIGQCVSINKRRDGDAEACQRQRDTQREVSMAKMRRSFGAWCLWVVFDALAAVGENRHMVEVTKKK